MFLVKLSNPIKERFAMMLLLEEIKTKMQPTLITPLLPLYLLIIVSIMDWISISLLLKMLSLNLFVQNASKIMLLFSTHLMLDFELIFTMKESLHLIFIKEFQ